MGLDSVELVMEYEDEFAIVMPDGTAAGFKTLGDVAAFVTASLLPRSSDVACSTAQTFRIVRRFLVERAGVARSEVVPDAPIQSLIPVRRRRELMRVLEAESRWPVTLEHHHALIYPAIVVHLAVTVATVYWIAASPMAGLAGPLAPVVIFAFAVLLVLCASPLTMCFPSHCKTIRDLVVRTSPPSHACDAIDPVVLQKIIAITAVQMGMKPEELSASTRFADLGVR